MPTRRTKVFTGCWTCRRRHLKCDELKPGCARCERSQIICEGYSIRLSWAPETSRRGRRETPGCIDFIVGNRRSLALDNAASAPRYHGPSIRTIQHGLTRRLSSHPAQSEGPFHVFKVETLAPPPSLNPDDSSGQTTDHSAVHNTEQFDYRSTATLSQLSSAYPESGSSQADGNDPTTGLNHGPTYEDDLHNVLNDSIMNVFSKAVNTRGLDSQHAESLEEFLAAAEAELEIRPATNRAPGIEPGPHGGQQTLSSVDVLIATTFGEPILRHIDLLQMPLRQKELMHHWSTHICRILLPECFPDNPYREIFIPLGLQGLQCAAHLPDYRVALFHAMCASSAHNLSILHGDDERYRSLGLKHECLALNIFRHGLVSNVEQDLVTIIALLSGLIISDDVSGQTRNWRHHLNIGARWLTAHLENSRNMTPQKQSFLQLFACSLLFYNHSLDISVINFYLRHLPLGQLVEMFGLSPQLVNIYCKIQQFLADPSTHNLDSLESHLDRLYSSFGDAPENTTGYGQSPQHNCALFYYAILVFFKRECRHVPADNIQHLVRRGLFHMESTLRCARENASLPILWPCLVIAAECSGSDLQQRAMKWFSSVETLGIRSIEIGRTACLSVWEQRELAPGQATVTWRNVMRDEDMFDINML